MASIVVSGDTSGSVTLSAPAAAGTTTLTLPTTTGTLALTSVPTVTLVSPYTGFKNRIINGGMVIAQRGTSAVTVNSNTGSNYYAVDRFFGQGQSADGVFTMQQSSTAPAGFSNSLLITVTTADTSLGATQVYQVVQPIEAYNTNDLSWGTASASTVTLSFWVRSSVTGTFGGALFNSAANRSYPFSYTISAANTFEQKSITIVGDTSGTWSGTNGVGIYVIFSLGTGSTYSGTAGAWAATTYNSATGATNLMATNSATWYITGVQLEVGSVASSFEYRAYGTELMLCQRYYYRQTGQAAGDYFVPNAYAIGTTQAFGYSTFPVPMRTRPTALEQSGTAADYNVVRCGLGTNANCSSVPTFGVANLTSAQTVFTVSSGLSNGTAGSAQANNTSAYLGWSAEL
jgi:hypothetical protein